MTIDTDTLKTQTDLLALAERDAELRRVASTEGGEWAGPCPFCGGRDRFRVQPHAPGGGRWLCRQCTEGKWHDVIAYVMRRESCDFRRACEVLGAAKSLPTRPRKVAPALPERTGPPSAEWQAAAREVIAVCEHNLWAADGERARAWLHERGLTDDTVRHWRIGYLPGGHREWREIARLSVPCGVVIPCEVGGNIWYVKVRRAIGEPRYIKIKGSRAALFGAEALLGQSVAVLCEGEFDALLLWQEAGSLAGVATLGSATGRLDVGAWAEYLLPLSRLLIAYDLDGAGGDGAQVLAGLTARARLVSVPQLREGDKDQTDYHKAGGNLCEWLATEIARHGFAANQQLAVNELPTIAKPVAGQEDEFTMPTPHELIIPDDASLDPFVGQPFDPDDVEPFPVPAWLVETLAERGVTVTHREGDRRAVEHTMGPEEELAVALAAMEANPTPENVRRFSNAAIRAGLPCGDALDPAAGWRAFADKHDPILPIHKTTEGVQHD